MASLGIQLAVLTKNSFETIKKQPNSYCMAAMRFYQLSKRWHDPI